MGNTKRFLYNFDTETFDHTDSPKTDEDALKYLPKGSPRTLFVLLREHYGYTINDAMLESLGRPKKTD